MSCFVSFTLLRHLPINRDIRNVQFHSAAKLLLANMKENRLADNQKRVIVLTSQLSSSAAFARQ